MINNEQIPKNDKRAVASIAARSVAISEGSEVAMGIAAELGICPSDHLNRDAILSTVVGAISNGVDDHTRLAELAALSVLRVQDGKTCRQ